MLSSQWEASYLDQRGRESILRNFYILVIECGSDRKKHPEGQNRLSSQWEASCLTQHNQDLEDKTLDKIMGSF